MSATDDLVELLSGESEICARLIAIAEKKRDFVIKADIGSLSRIVQEETALIGEANRLEKKRIAVSRALGLRLGLPEKTCSLSEIADRTEDPRLKDKLLLLRTDISQLLQKLQSLNAVNGALIAQKREYNAAMIAALQRSEQIGCFYDSKGCSGTYNSGSGLIDRQI